MWAHHPDIRERPVDVQLSTACGVVFDGTLRSDQPISLGIVVPEGVAGLDMVVTASRTWVPAEHGGQDRRRLGVAVSTEVLGGPAEVLARDYAVEWPACEAGR
jgi:hypothetical protein